MVMKLKPWGRDWEDRGGTTSKILRIGTEGSMKNVSKKISLLAPTGSQYPSTDWPMWQGSGLRFNVLPAEFLCFFFFICLFNFLIPPLWNGLTTLCLDPIVSWQYTIWILTALWAQSWMFAVSETLDLDFGANLEHLRPWTLTVTNWLRWILLYLDRNRGPTEWSR